MRKSVRCANTSDGGLIPPGAKHSPCDARLALDELAARFWSWRAGQQPRSHDDIPRIGRPAGWLADWSPDAVADYRVRAADFEAQWHAIALPDVKGAEASARRLIVDHALIGSAIARVGWELDVTRLWQVHPRFYLDQSLGAVFDQLLVQGPFEKARTEWIIATLRHTPTVLAWGQENLHGHACTEFTRITAQSLTDIAAAVASSIGELAPLVPAELGSDLIEAGELAGRSLADFRGWLTSPGLPTTPWAPVGRDQVQHFLREVALIPLTPDQLLSIGAQERCRAEALSAIEHATTDQMHDDPLFAAVADQVAQEEKDEDSIRAFYEDREILSQPETLGRYLIAALPSYIAPLQFLGVTNDLTSDTRLEENAVSYMPDPHDGLPYFYSANARDPRAGIIHEGAHYQQLALAWRHENPIRRRYYDSGPNEGIAFYNEELMLRAGLFNDRPATRRIMHSFLRLRPLRVTADIELAVGARSIEDAARFFVENVPMDWETAFDEAAFFASTPAQGMTYQIGKSQILAFLAETTRAQGSEFSLRRFHDRLWCEGNVPIALQRYELLGLTDELSAIRL